MGKKVYSLAKRCLRAGKTFLCKSIPDIIYFDCELPKTRLETEDPESLFSNLRGKKLFWMRYIDLPILLRCLK